MRHIAGVLLALLASAALGQSYSGTQNSNGYPIIKSGGKEYMQCN